MSKKSIFVLIFCKFSSFKFEKVVFFKIKMSCGVIILSSDRILDVIETLSSNGVSFNKGVSIEIFLICSNSLIIKFPNLVSANIVFVILILSSSSLVKNTDDDAFKIGKFLTRFSLNLIIKYGVCFSNDYIKEMCGLKNLNEEKENIDEDIKTNGNDKSRIEYDISQLKVKISELNKNILILLILFRLKMFVNLWHSCFFMY